MIEKTRILVIDDEKMIREMISIMLVRKGCKVTICKNGKEGIHCFVAGNYDIILTDLVMPEMSGFEVAEIVRKLDPYVPIALVTSDAPDINSIEAKNRFGIDMLLAKPFTFDQLIGLVANAMKLRKTREISYSAAA